MKTIQTTLNNYGRLAVEVLQLDVHNLSATGKTERSINYKIESDTDTDRLLLLARPFFSALETGRGPRKSSQYKEYDKSLLEYMEARGLLSGLTKKQKESRAKSLAWYINKHGDKTYREGGREVYSKHLDKLVRELKEALKKDFKQYSINEIRKSFSTKNQV